MGGGVVHYLCNTITRYEQACKIVEWLVSRGVPSPFGGDATTSHRRGLSYGRIRRARGRSIYGDGLCPAIRLKVGQVVAEPVGQERSHRHDITRGDRVGPAIGSAQAQRA